MASLDKKKQKSFGNFSFVSSEDLLRKGFFGNPLTPPSKSPSPENNSESQTLLLKKNFCKFFGVYREVPFKKLSLLRKELMGYFKVNDLLETHPRKGLNIAK